MLSGELVTVAKAYSGLSDEELNEVDRYVRKNITGKFGPVRMVRPGLFLRSLLRVPGHRAGTSRAWPCVFPVSKSWRKDKEPNRGGYLGKLDRLCPGWAKRSGGRS